MDLVKVTLAREADDSWILEQCAVLPPMKEPFEPETWWKFSRVFWKTQKWGFILEMFHTRWDPPKKPVKKVGWNNSTYRGYISITPGKIHQAIHRGEITGSPHQVAIFALPPKNHHCKNTKISIKREGRNGDVGSRLHLSPLRIPSFASTNWWLVQMNFPFGKA